MDKLRDPKIQGAVRHLLSTFGPCLGLIATLVQADVLTASEVATMVFTSWETIVGLLMAVLAFWASWTAKEKT